MVYAFILWSKGPYPGADLQFPSVSTCSETGI
jgi:hypothetical protein